MDNQYLDSVDSLTSGYGTLFAAQYTTSYNALTADNLSASVTIAEFQLVPEPGSMMLAGAGLLLLGAWRARRR
jgi:hypothetical protein